MKKLKFTLPDPCHQDWNKMSPTELGKFCSSCEKEVFDFTTYSDEQLIKNLDVKDNVCGRFTDKQLNRDLRLQRKKHHNYLSYTFSGLLSVLLLNSSATKAQEKPRTIQTDKNFKSIPLQNTRVTDSITISGTVLDETRYPLPGATVLIKGTTIGATTDFDGNFNLNCKVTDTVVFSYVGYIDFEAKANSKEMIIELKLDKTLNNVVLTSMGIVRKHHELSNGNINVTGTLFDETNIPLPGATVLIKGTTTGTTTDIDGNFNLNCKATDTLVFSYVGYNDYETLANNILNIIMTLNNEHSDVIIVAGGIRRKEYSTTILKEGANRLKKRWIGGNLFTRFTNIFRKNNKNPNYRF
jgi:hypothetical protein